MRQLWKKKKLGTQVFSKFILGILLLTSCLSCQSSQKEPHTLDQWIDDDGTLRVLCTIEMITDIVEAIGGEHVSCHTLIRGELDPHSYELVKGDDEYFIVADLIFYNGLGLEHGPSLRRQLEEKPLSFALGELIKKEYPSRILDVGGQADPHIWMDVDLWLKTLPHIVKGLSRARPQHQATFQKNALDLSEKMRQKDEDIFALMQAIPAHKRYLVTSHDAFCYFARRYLSVEEEQENNTWGKRCEAPEGLSPDGQLSATDIQRLIDHLMRYRIFVLFPESNVSQDSIRKILDAGREKGLFISIARTPLYSDAMGPPGSSGDSYLKMLEHNARTIAHHLRENLEQ